MFGYIPDPALKADKNWYTLERETRAVLVAYVRLKRLTKDLLQYDEHDRQARERKRQQRSKPPARIPRSPRRR